MQATCIGTIMSKMFARAWQDYYTDVNPCPLTFHGRAVMENSNWGRMSEECFTQKLCAPACGQETLVTLSSHLPIKLTDICIAAGSYLFWRLCAQVCISSMANLKSTWRQNIIHMCNNFMHKSQCACTIIGPARQCRLTAILFTVNCTTLQSCFSHNYGHCQHILCLFIFVTVSIG